MIPPICQSIILVLCRYEKEGEASAPPSFFMPFVDRFLEVRKMILTKLSGKQYNAIALNVEGWLAVLINTRKPRV